MGSINIRKRGKVFQYSFEIAKITGKRKQITKSGFRTKGEALEEGTKAYSEYLNTGIEFKENQISYNDYLDYWLENYCKANLKYNTVKAYITIIEKYLKPNLGIYRLTSITNVTLNTFISEFCMKHDFSRAYFANILKVLKGSMRDACDIYGFIRYTHTGDNKPYFTFPNVAFGYQISKDQKESLYKLMDYNNEKITTEIVEMIENGNDGHNNASSITYRRML